MNSLGLIRNIILMGNSTAVRLIFALLTFSVVARQLGPDSFGILMFWFSVSALISLVINFGMTTYALREIGADPSSAESIINECLTGKILLSLLVLGCASILAWVIDAEYKIVFFCLLAASMADTFSELLYAGLRARDRYDVEARLANFTSIIHAIIVVGVAVLLPIVAAVAVAYAISRLLVLTFTIFSVTKHFAAPRLADVKASIVRLNKAVSYAVDFGLQSLFGQVDSVVLNHYLGSPAVGLYQAGMRVFQGGSSVVQVLANVFLPRAAGKMNDSAAFGRESMRLQTAFLSFAAFFGIALSLFSETIVHILFGTAYSNLAELFPLLGLLFFVRFAAAAWGVVLTADGEQRYRSIATIAHWCLIAVIAPFLVPSMDIAGWLITLIIGNVLLGFLYALRGAKRVASPWVTLGMTALGGVAFVPFLHN